MGRKKLLLVTIIFTLILVPMIYSEDTFIETIVLQQIENQEEVSVILELEKSPEDLSYVERLSATDVELDALGDNKFTAKVNAEELNDLLEDPNIIKIEEDEIFHLFLADSVPLINASSLHAKQYESTNLTGEGQTICVIDSGIDSTHTSLAGRIIAEHCFCDVSDYGSGGCCSDNTHEVADAEDDNGHGTHVAGIVAANGTDVLGVAPAANLVAVKVSNSAGLALFSDITEGVQFCITNAVEYNISVITLSMGSGGYSAHCDASYSSLSTLINTAFNNNITVTVSTGNDYSTTLISSPSCINRSIAVSSIDKNSGVSSFANRNSITDIMAPGGSIYSTKMGGGTQPMSGTSMAAPHVAGAIALLQQYKQEVEGRMLTGLEVNNTITTNGPTIDDSGGSGNLFTRIDLLASLYAIDEMGPIFLNPHTSEDPLFPNENITFIVNVSEVNIDAVWIEGNWSGSLQNYSMTNDYGNVYNFSLGNHNLSSGQTFKWRIHGNDTIGNNNLTIFIESLISSAPSITIHGPSNNIISSSPIIFNFTVDDDIDAQIPCNLIINNSVNQTNSTTLDEVVTNFNVTLGDGTYAWYISCTDSDPYTINSSVRTITIDSNKPVFSSESLTSTVELGDLQRYSITVTDANVVYVNFSYNGENTTMSNTSTSFSKNFLPLTIGTNNYVVYAKDAAGNINSTSGSFTVQDTISGPRITSKTYTSSIAQGSTQTVTAHIFNANPLSSVKIDFEGTNYTMTNNTVYNFTKGYTTDDCGDVSFKIRATDSAGVSILNTTSYTITSCSSSTTTSTTSSSASAASSTTESKKITKIFQSAGPSAPIDMDIDNSNIPVYEILIDLKNELTNVKVSAEGLDSKPSGVTTPSGSLYKYLDISIINFENSDISTAKMKFHIPTSWFNDNNIDKSTVVLQRYNGSWGSLETDLSSQSGGKVYYTAETPGFSYFAITGEKMASAEISPQAEEEIATLHNETDKTIVGSILGAPEKKFKLDLISGIIISLGVFILILIVFVTIYFMREPENPNSLNS